MNTNRNIWSKAALEELKKYQRVDYVQMELDRIKNDPAYFANRYMRLVPVVIQGPTEDIPYEDVTPKQLEEK